MNVNVDLLCAFKEYVKVLCGDSYKQEFVKFKLGPEKIVLRFEPTSGDIDANRANQEVQCMKLSFERLMHPSFDILSKYKGITFKYELNMAGERDENGDLIPPFFELHIPCNALAQGQAIKLIGEAMRVIKPAL